MQIGAMLITWQHWRSARQLSALGPVDEARRLDGAFEFACQSTARQQNDLWGQGESQFRALAQTLDEGRAVSAQPQWGTGEQFAWSWDGPS